MGLVDHNDDVAAVAQGLIAVGELLHGGEDDAVRLAPLKQVLEVLAALRLDRCLAEERGAAPELAVELVV